MPAGFRWPEGVRAAACFTFDMDAESPILFEHPEAAGWLDVMSHQAYGPRTGGPRLLRVLDRQGIRATFFVPGYTAERWPYAVRSIRDAGHEIGHHGYLHEGAHGTDAAEQPSPSVARPSPVEVAGFPRCAPARGEPTVGALTETGNGGLKGGWRNGPARASFPSL